MPAETGDCGKEVKILAVSDVLVQFIYSPHIRQRFADVDLIFSCGDLPYYYHEYMISMLDVPLYYVHGNHDQTEYGETGHRDAPQGGFNLHRKLVCERGLLLGGIEGSIRYREGVYQYSQGEMWFHVFALVPGMILNRMRYGRYLDIFVTHSPPLGIHDKPDLAHQGIKAFRWLLKVFQPALHLHGHVHVYRTDDTFQSTCGLTRVINSYGFRETSVLCHPFPARLKKSFLKGV